MTQNRRDLYGECNVDGAPVDQFTAECCMKCINPECTRSTYGQNKFDIRVNSWYERLFSDVPRMERDDPRYAEFNSQLFLPIQPPIEVNSWVDPRDLGKEPPLQVRKPVSVPESENLQEDPPKNKEGDLDNNSDIKKENPEKTEKNKASHGKKRLPLSTASSLATTNTPNKQGLMIKEGASSASPPKVDSSWDSPPTTSSGTKGIRVIKPGEKIKLG